MSFLPFYDTDNDPNFTKLIPKIKDFTSKLNSFNFDFKKFKPLEFRDYHPFQGSGLSAKDTGVSKNAAAR